MTVSQTFFIALLLAGLWSNTNAQIPELDWAGTIEHNSFNITGTAIATDVSGNTYSTGYFSGTVDFDPGPGVYHLVSDEHSYDLFIRKTNASGQFIWAQKIGGEATDGGNAVVADLAGNVYMTGFYAKTVDFDPGTGIAELAAVGTYSSFVLKLDASGNFQWVKNIGSTGFAEGRGIGLDASGNIYTCGQFSETVKFNSGAYSLTSSGSYDGFVEKLNPAGDFLWAVHTNGADAENYGPLSIDASGNIYLTGGFRGTVDFDPGAGAFTLVATGQADIFVQKLDEGGHLQWVVAMGGTGSDYSTSIGYDSEGNVYLAGGHNAPADFDPGPGTFTLWATGFKGLFVEKLDKTGHFVWAKGLDVDGFADCKMVADAAGNVFLTGYFVKTVDFDPGPGGYLLISNGDEDIFLEKLDASGVFLWAKSIGGPSEDAGVDIALDASGNIHTTGNFFGLTDFDPGSDTLNLFPGFGPGAYLHKMDSAGHLIWANTTKGFSGFTSGAAMTPNAAGEVYSAGAYSGTLDFDPGPDTASLNVEMNQRMFLRKQDTDGRLIWLKDFGGGERGLCLTLTTDATGNVCAAGSFSHTADFDPDPNTVFNLTSSGEDDVFIQKTDSSGHLLWVKRVGGAGKDHSLKVCTDAFGNVYVGGVFSATVDFDPGPGVFEMSVAPGAIADHFILKLDVSGNFLWAKKLVKSADTDIYKEATMAVDSSGNVYRTGGFYGMPDFDPGPGVFNLSAFVGTEDIFIQKLDASGNFLWAKKIGGSDTDRGQSIAVDASGNVYVAGVYRDTVDLDPGPGIFQQTATFLGNLFIEKLDKDGNFLWVKSLELVANVPEISIELDAARNIYSTGNFNTTCDMDPGPGTYLVTPTGGYDVFSTNWIRTVIFNGYKPWAAREVPSWAKK
ncbi:MAG: SBBP repeat-containing protein [Lewinellaceae bacterium]|nr:SBBP repeat-containing protein [Lewinellaceae bacterium]